ncbi:MAG: TIGR04086 family membrane protein [Firmicutes bacterium]|nr:TIGR04086 family membrane protein [Bacillota bacterium]
MMRKTRSSVQNGMLLTSPEPLVLCRGLLVTMAFSFILLLFNTLLFFFFPLSELFVPYFIFGFTLISILVGSVYIGKRVEKKGWLKGGMLGLIYVLILIILSFTCLPGLAFNLNIFTKLFIGFAFGTIGGILGINS